MSLQEQQNLLAKLYTDAALRDEFFEFPHETGARFNMTERESDDLALVVRDELEYFAESLFRKRLAEVEKLLPLTRIVAAGEFASMFREFAAGFTPISVRKHLDDALAFGAFLIARGAVVETARFECSKLAFLNSDRRFAVCITRIDPATGAPTRPRIAVWRRRGSRIGFHLI